MNILITGSAGFIGYHLVNQLLKTNNKIYGCDNLSSQSSETQKIRFRLLKKKKIFDFKKFDLKNYSKFSKYYQTKKIDIIIHLAAQPGVRISQNKPLKTIDQNIKTFVNLMEFCKDNNIKNFFYASSSSIYGNENKFSENATQKNVSSIYAATKVCNEIFANVYNYHYEINTLGLRFFTVYGPLGREDMAYFKFLKQIKKDKKIKIYGDKNSIRSFTYVDDVTKSIILLMNKFTKKSKYNECFNIGNYKKNSLNDLVNTIKKFYSKDFSEEINDRNKADVFKTHSSILKLKKSINFYPKTNLEKGMKKFIEWFKKSKY